MFAHLDSGICCFWPPFSLLFIFFAPFPLRFCLLLMVLVLMPENFKARVSRAYCIWKSPSFGDGFRVALLVLSPPPPTLSLLLLLLPFCIHCVVVARHGYHKIKKTMQMHMHARIHTSAHRNVMRANWTNAGEIESGAAIWHVFSIFRAAQIFHAEKLTHSLFSVAVANLRLYISKPKN